jgi:hypothetical protein
MAKSQGGGGYNSRVNRDVPIRYGQSARKVSEGGSDQLGQAMGAKRIGDRITSQNSAKNLYSGSLPGVGSQKLGNETSAQIKAMGQGRTVHARGTQNQWGSVAPGNPPAHRPILSEYGPDTHNASKRR